MPGDAAEDLNPVDFTKYQIQQAAASVYYIPDFITECEETYLLKKINDAPLPKWTQLSNRRLQNWGGEPHPKGMIAEEMPQWLKSYTKRVGDIEGLFGAKKPNHVLINEYLPGQGIMPHLDGPLFYPTITTISLGSHAVLNFYRPLDDPADSGQSEDKDTSSQWSSRLEFSLLVQPRSLLILKDKAYDYYLHGIEEVNEDVITPNVVNATACPFSEGDNLVRSTRVSMTIRHVPGTTKPLLKFFGKVNK